MEIKGLTDWQILLSMLPSNWQDLAKQTHALTRKLRSFKDEESILRVFFLHFAKGYSLRETVTRASLLGLAQISDVALLKRLRCSEQWLKALCLALFRERGVSLEANQTKIRFRLVDGTLVKEPGKTGGQWRIHYSLVLPEFECDYFKLTASEGKETGEKFNQYPVKKNDCIVGDRIYSTIQGIGYLHDQEAYSLVRVNSGALKFYGIKEAFDLLGNISCLDKAQDVREWEVRIKKKDGKYIDGRLCVMRKSIEAEKLAIKKLKQAASKRQTKLKPTTLEYAKYIIIFTTLPKEEYSLLTVLNWYRLRWQIELAFKRLKSLAYLGHLPKYDDQSAKAWLYGKMLVTLLTEKLLSYAGSLSPCGYGL